MSPSISTRDSIRWLPEPASEPTRTVVLTSPENRFVDIRILRPPPGFGEYNERLENHLTPDRIDWAFAGISSSTISKAPQTGHIAHSVWAHWVDSRHAEAEKVSDEGDMYALADGRTLEKGAMVNPATGVMTEYEEIWKDVEIIPTWKVVRSAGSEVAGEQAGGEQAGSGKGKGQGKAIHDDDNSNGDEQQHRKPRPTCTVLILNHESEIQTRGMVIQLGQFCQGVFRYGDQFSLERWIWGENAGWKREVGIGADWMPCGLVTGGAEKVPEIGGTVSFGGMTWVVVEKGEV